MGRINQPAAAAPVQMRGVPTTFARTRPSHPVPDPVLYSAEPTEQTRQELMARQLRFFSNMMTLGLQPQPVPAERRSSSRPRRSRPANVLFGSVDSFEEAAALQYDSL